MTSNFRARRDAEHADPPRRAGERPAAKEVEHLDRHEQVERCGPGLRDRRAVGAFPLVEPVCTIARSASSAASALDSCTNPTPAFISTTPKMTDASTSSPKPSVTIPALSRT